MRAPQQKKESHILCESALYLSGGQNIGATASASILPMNIQGGFPLGWTG